MKNLKVGDKVKIKQDLVLGKFYNNCRYQTPMEKYAGKVATITTVFQDSETEVNYNLDIDIGEWFWDSEMLISVEEDKSYNKMESVSMINYKDKTFSDEVVREMLSQPAIFTLEDTIAHTVNKKLEEESVRLAKAVCEYEEIVHNLEKELNNMLENKNTYKAMYQEMLDRHTNLIDEYNTLVGEYNELVDEYNSLI